MAELDAKLFRDYFEGSWTYKVFRNGEFVREVVVNRQGDHGKSTDASSNALWILPPGEGGLNGPDHVAVAGWHGDIHRWCDRWYNELGGYGELCWTSQAVVNGVKVLYGSVHECEREGDDPADYIAMCELYDQDNFKYTIQSYRKGILEVVASRVKTAKELTEIQDAQAKTSRSPGNLAGRKQECVKAIEQERFLHSQSTEDKFFN